MSKNFKTPDFSRMWKQLRQDLVEIAATEGENFFHSSFDKEGFTDVAFEPWQKTHEQLGYKILTRGGTLRKSVQTFEESLNRIVFGSDSEYAEIHNNGGIIPITKRSRGFFWKMYEKTGDIKWKYLALTKADHFKMPKRQFIGESKTLLDKLDKILTGEISERFNNLK